MVFDPLPTTHAHCPITLWVRSPEFLLYPQTFLGTGVRGNSRSGPDSPRPFSFPCGGIGPRTCQSAPGSRLLGWNSSTREPSGPRRDVCPKATGRTSLGPLSCATTLSPPGLCPWTTPHPACPSPQYLAGSSGGQAGGHVTLWVSSASMSLSRSVFTSAPATVDEEGHRQGREDSSRRNAVSSAHRSQGRGAASSKRSAGGQLSPALAALSYAGGPLPWGPGGLPEGLSALPLQLPAPEAKGKSGNMATLPTPRTLDGPTQKGSWASLLTAPSRLAEKTAGKAPIRWGAYPSAAVAAEETQGKGGGRGRETPGRPQARTPT